MPRALKEFLYRHSWIGMLALGGAALAAYAARRISLQEILAFGGAIAAAFYFFQKQQIEELSLLERLFADFNQRYNAMNDRLLLVRTSRAALSPRDLGCLEDYFNLCAEEYFYFERGIIDSRIWAAWCKGMLQYLEDPRIAAFWAAEEAGDSYYGLTREKIEAGADGETPAPARLRRAA